MILYLILKVIIIIIMILKTFNLFHFLNNRISIEMVFCERDIFR